MKNAWQFSPNCIVNSILHVMEDEVAEPIRIGIVGCGRIVPAHMRGYATLRERGIDNFRITALFSRKREDAEMFRKRGEGPPPRASVVSQPGSKDPLAAPHMYVSDFQNDVEARVFDSFDELLESGDVDALDIPASVFTHHEYAVKAANAGKHVLVQKPLAVSVAAGRAMVDAARQNGTTLGVTENVRYAEGSRLARWAIERGDIGDLQMVASVSIGAIEWSPDKVVADTPWRHSRILAGGGTTADIGVHALHRIRYVCGEVARIGALTRTFEPVRYRYGADGRVTEAVQADADDAFMAMFELENGAIGQLSFTWAGHGEPTGLPEGMVIYGSKGSIKGNTLYRDGSAPVSVREWFQSEATPEERERWLPLGLTDTFAAGFYDFLSSIERHGQPEASGEEGLRDVAAAFGMLESSHLGQMVRVEDVLSGKICSVQRDIDAHYGLG